MDFNRAVMQEYLKAEEIEREEAKIKSEIEANKQASKRRQLGG